MPSCLGSLARQKSVRVRYPRDPMVDRPAPCTHTPRRAARRPRTTPPSRRTRSPRAQGSPRGHCGRNPSALSRRLSLEHGAKVTSAALHRPCTGCMHPEGPMEGRSRNGRPGPSESGARQDAPSRRGSERVHPPCPQSPPCLATCAHAVSRSGRLLPPLRSHRGVYAVRTCVPRATLPVAGGWCPQRRGAAP